MREILFRGKAKAGYKRITEGEWIEGSLFYSDNENKTVCQIATSYLSASKAEPVMVVVYEVDPSTVCQYTGLTDKNDRKIFEGDILKIPEKKNHNVKFEYGQFCVGINCPIAYVRTECEVIGNIFDNPDLVNE